MTAIPSIPLRPSSLPKLAECPRYESEPVAGAAADRGTAMDSAFRAILDGSHVGFLPDTNPEDIAAIRWAVDAFKILAGNAPIQSSEKDLKVEMLGMTGTADGACPEKLFSVDIKSGQVRDYEAQMAAYALGFMEREFCENWTTHLLFCDERRIVSMSWTQESAWDVVNPIIALAKDPQATPTPCDYCGWCAKRWICATRLEPLSILLTGAPDKLDLVSIKAHPADLGRLLDITHAIAKDEGLHDELRAAALAHLLAQKTVPGWTLANGRKTESVPALMLAENFGPKNLLRDAGSAKVMQALGNVTGSKFKTLWAEVYPGSTPPEGVIQTNHGAAFVAKSKAKKVSATSATSA